jgi:hypothetical protein
MVISLVFAHTTRTTVVTQTADLEALTVWYRERQAFKKSSVTLNTVVRIAIIIVKIMMNMMNMIIIIIMMMIEYNIPNINII